MKILVIEDSRILQVALKRVLMKAGYDVISAGDGQKGLDLACKFLPDLVLLDMMLPTLTGTSVLAALKSGGTTKSIPVFVLTGLSQKNEEKLLDAGATRYFEKSEALLEHDFGALLEAIASYTTEKAR